MSSHRSLWIFAGLCVLAAAAATAGESPGKPFDISTPGSFEQQAAAVRAGLQPGGAYDFLSQQERTRVELRIADMNALFGRYGSIQAMGGAGRVELFNAQESANQILTRDRSGTIECAWAEPTGSHVPRTLCWYTET